MPRKSHRRRRKKMVVPVRLGEPVGPTWRVSVKCGPAWFIAYEGGDERWVEEVKHRYKDRSIEVERI